MFGLVSWTTVPGRAASTPLDDACGTDPGTLCEWAFDATNGNETVAGLVDWLIGRPLKIALILFVAWLVTRLVRRWLVKLIRRVVVTDRDVARRQLRRFGVDDPAKLLGEEDPALRLRREGRAASISAVVGSTASVAIWAIAIIMVLGELELNLGPLIAGAGITGVALGFGAQSLVKDCLSGLFMLIEDQYGIGDVVDLGEAIGEVEEVALRTTVIRSLDGTVWHVPNGEIARVGNLSQLWSMALVDIDVAYDADLEAVRALMLQTATEVCASEEWRDDVLDEPNVLGVETLGADGITLRMVVKTAPGAQWAMQRRLREALKYALDDAGVEIPFPQRTVWMRNETT